MSADMPETPDIPDTADAASRGAELAEALAQVRARIAHACQAAGRDRHDVRLLAVTKTFPASDVALLSDLGLTEFAENRDQEAAAKVRELQRLRPAARPRWHMVGRMQRNKARSVARWASEVQSVDSVRLAEALASAVRRAVESGQGEAARAGSSTMDVLIQVSLDDDPRRGGCPVADIPELVVNITRSGVLRLRGVMAVAPLSAPDAGLDAVFARLGGIARDLAARHPDARELSAGMSGDLETAIAHGSTCVRVGTALLGGRRLASPQEGCPSAGR